MSTIAPTEADRAIAVTAMSAADVDFVARLIAEAKARHAEQIIIEKDDAQRALTNVQRERDQLRAEVERQSRVSAEVVGEASRQVAASDNLFRETRAEVERLTKERDFKASESEAALAVLQHTKARAERAEAEVAELKKKQPINTHVRLFDLVRFMRAELHEQNLITDEEYSWLCAGSPMAISPRGGSPSPRRLEDYDDLRAELAAERKALAEERGKVRALIYAGQMALESDDNIKQATDAQLEAAAQNGPEPVQRGARAVLALRIAVKVATEPVTSRKSDTQEAAP